MTLSSFASQKCSIKSLNSIFFYKQFPQVNQSARNDISKAIQQILLKFSEEVYFIKSYAMN